MKHTKGKWMLDKKESRAILIPSKLGMIVQVVPEFSELELAKANAEHIVRCVNGYDTLRELLNEAITDTRLASSSEDIPFIDRAIKALEL